MKPERKKGQARQTPEAHSPPRSRANDSEPSVAHGPLPVWIFIVLALAVFWGMVYLDNHAGGFSPLVYNRFTSTNDLAKAAPVDPAQKAFLAGQGVYNTLCLGCHQPNGLGTPGMYPPLDGSEWVLTQDPSRIIRIVSDGLTGPITVKGQQWPGTTAMPGFRGTGPSEEDLANVLTFVRNAWSNKAPPVAPEQVAAIQQETAAHAGRNWTAEELLQVPLTE